MSLKYIAEILPALLSGAGMTLSIFFWTLILATPLGILVSLGEKVSLNHYAGWLTFMFGLCGARPYYCN